jgi:hypothetical protein
MRRYKNDISDRIWSPFENSDWRQLKTSINNVNGSFQNDYKPPAIVMSTAATPVDVNEPLEIEWEGDNENDQYYLYLYFNEVEKLAANETRAFNIKVNGDFWYGPMIPRYGSAYTIFSRDPFPRAATYLVSLSKTGNSTLPPILNAIEIYNVKDFSQSETEQNDGKLVI